MNQKDPQKKNVAGPENDVFRAAEAIVDAALCCSAGALEQHEKEALVKAVAEEPLLTEDLFQRGNQTVH